MDTLLRPAKFYLLNPKPYSIVKPDENYDYDVQKELQEFRKAAVGKGYNTARHSQGSNSFNQKGCYLAHGQIEKATLDCTSLRGGKGKGTRL